MGAGFGLWDKIGEEQRDLQRRWASVIAGAADAADAFDDWTPAWRGSVHHSADIQIAAADLDAVARGDFLLVLGDFHGGDNPLRRACSGCGIPTPRRCCGASRRRAGRASTSPRRAAASST
jgi:hypothetical protein